MAISSDELVGTLFAQGLNEGVNELSNFVEGSTPTIVNIDTSLLLNAGIGGLALAWAHFANPPQSQKNVALITGAGLVVKATVEGVRKILEGTTQRATRASSVSRRFQVRSTGAPPVPAGRPPSGIKSGAAGAAIF